MKTLGYYNGKYGEIDEMTIPMNDRACWFGDGVYDATCCGNYVIFNLEEHIDRFYNSAGLLGIKIPMQKAELAALLSDLVRKLDSPDQFVYWQATRGTAPRNHAFPKEGSANIWVFCRPARIGDMENERLKLITVEDTRFLHCNVKTLNLIPNVLAAQKTEEAGADEAVFYRAGGRVTECAHSNVHILKDGMLKTAPTDHMILPGIARAHLIKMAKKLCIPVDEHPFTLDELMDADEVIVTASSNFCMQAAEVDGKPVGGKAHELLRALQHELLEEYLEYTHQK